MRGVRRLLWHSSTGIRPSSTSTTSSSTTASSSAHAPTTTAIAPVFASPMHATTSSTSVCLVFGLLFFYDVDDFVRHSEVLNLPNISASSRETPDNTYCAAANVDLGQPHELVTVCARLHNLLQCEVHPCVAVDQKSVQGFTALELDQHGVAGCGRQKA
jgi:hypothetical protein